jgi:AraC family transcriptional regulator
MDRERAPVRYATDHTADDWTRAVLRSIGTMRKPRRRTLVTHPRPVGLLSPFHFYLVFHKVTDSTPARFLAAWRMAEATRLLAYSRASVTDICMQIGYSSLGTFTSQFTRLVGVSPGRFRRAVATFAGRSFNEVLAGLGPQMPRAGTGPGDRFGGRRTGRRCPGRGRALSSGIPQQPPLACAVVQVPGFAVFGDPPDGVYPHWRCASIHR